MATLSEGWRGSDPEMVTQERLHSQMNILLKPCFSPAIICQIGERVDTCQENFKKW